MEKTFLIVVCLLGLVVTGVEADNSGSAVGPSPPLSSVRVEVPLTEVRPVPDLHDRFVEGILKSRSIKPDLKRKTERKPYWFECGKRIRGEKARRERASEWATGILRAVELANTAHNIELNPWGVFAVTHKESGFNECSLDLQTREWAVKQGLVKRLKQTYTKDTVYKIISSKHFNRARRRADLGPMQVRYGGKLSREKMDQILSLNPGMVWAAGEMAERSVDYPVKRKGRSKPQPRPWKLWPTLNARSVRSFEYDIRITRIARWLGAKFEEI